VTHTRPELERRTGYTGRDVARTEDPYRERLTAATRTVAAVFIGGMGVWGLGCGKGDGEGVAAPLRVARVLGEVGSSPGQYSYPRAMAAADDSLWVMDKLARVQRIDLKTGRARGEFQMPQWEMGKPTGIGIWNPTPVDGDEVIYVPDTHYFRVMVYRASDAKPGVHSIRASTGTAEVGSESGNAKSPTPLAQFGTYGEGDGQFVYVTDVALLPSADGKRVERVYVSEYGGHDRISIYEPPADVTVPGGEYRFVRAFGRFGSGAGADPVEFNRPQSMALDLKRRELVVTDACNHRVGRFTLDGELVKWISGPGGMGEGPGSFKYPYGVEVMEDGTAMVAEFGNNRLQRIDLETGESRGVFGVPGRAKGQLSTPWAVTWIGGEAYVLDSGNNRIQVFEKPD
jgi:hypothetical protein